MTLVGYVTLVKCLAVIVFYVARVEVLAHVARQAFGHVSTIADVLNIARVYRVARVSRHAVV
jgi:hypothetical protein